MTQVHLTLLDDLIPGLKKKTAPKVVEPLQEPIPSLRELLADGAKQSKKNKSKNPTLF